MTASTIDKSAPRSRPAFRMPHRGRHDLGTCRVGRLVRRG